MNTNPAIQRTMVKTVKIHAPIAIRTVSPTIYGDIEKTSMNPAMILKCLIGRATVWEIMPDGSLLKLNDQNYNTVNQPLPTVAKTKQTLASEVDHSAPEIDDGTKFKNIILKDKIAPTDTVDIAPGTVEDLNAKIAEAGEVPAPKMEETSTEDIDDSDEAAETSTTAEMTDEEKELAEIQAQIDALDAEEQHKGKKNKK